MSDWTDEDLTDILGDEQNDNSTIRVLRQKIKTDSQAMKELKQEVATLREARRNDVVGEALKSAGLNPSVAKFYTGESDPTAVQAWIEENGNLFGGISSAPAEHIPSPIDGTRVVQPTVPQNVIPPEMQVDYERIMHAGVDGLPPSNYNDIMGALNSATSMEELNAAISRFR